MSALHIAEFLYHACRLWKITVQDVHVSALHREVSDCLAHMGVAHLLEHLAVDGLFSLDIVLLPDSPTRICIEVDGPYHYTVNTLQPMGHTLIRWAVVGPTCTWPLVSHLPRDRLKNCVSCMFVKKAF